MTKADPWVDAKAWLADQDNAGTGLIPGLLPNHVAVTW